MGDESHYVCALQVFTEAEVRASLVFQVSKLCSCMLKAARLATGGAAWDALVAGPALHTLHHTLHHTCSLLCICHMTAVCMTRLSATADMITSATSSQLCCLYVRRLS